jgi:2-polyprenyl-6-methoxyphenol hydroxylase-like FAD-dependent oxidoreductase
LNTQSSLNYHKNQPAFGHAVVIGGSIAGLTAGRVLTDYFAQVTIIERDRLPDTPEFRPGVPQARHAHLLLPPGQAILEQQFPGLIVELQANGATLINSSGEMSFCLDDAWYDDMPSLICSRPLLEITLARRLAAHPGVRFLQEQEVLGLGVDQHGQQVTGVRLRRRRGLDAGRPETQLAVELVVDASGRGSHAPQWLANLGFTPPQETTVNAFAGYTSRLYRRPPGFNENWKMMRIRRTPPDDRRGGYILPLEGDRWLVTLIGMGRDYPPTDEAGFLAFARSLPSLRLYEAITVAEPLTKAYGFRLTESRLRHYDQLQRYLEGFLVCGDAACALSPVHAQGMTAAVMGTQALADCLTEQRRRGDMLDLARTFQQRLSQTTSSVWQLVTEDDRRWPATEVAENIIPIRQRVPDHRSNPVPAPTRYDIAYL